MAGQIVKRGDQTWLVRVPMGRDADGKRLYHNRTIKGTKKDAERYRTLKLRELDTGTFVEASQQGLRDFLLNWLDTVAAPRVRSRTLEDYRALVARHIIPGLGQRRLAQLSPADIQRFYARLQEDGLSSRTIRYVHSVLHSALDEAVRWRLLASNPAKLVTLPRQDRREMTSLSPQQASLFLDACRGTRFEALWILLLSAGLRPGEALGLKWSDISGNRLHVQRSLTRLRDGAWELREPKTARARRVVSLPPSTSRALQQQRAIQLEERLKCGASWQPLDLVFATASGEPLEWRVLVRRHFGRILDSAGLPRIRPYDLRHTCATLLLASGENVKVVSERLGHSSATLTLDTYTHVLPDMQQGAADRLEALLFAPSALSR